MLSNVVRITASAAFLLAVVGLTEAQQLPGLPAAPEPPPPVRATPAQPVVPGQPATGAQPAAAVTTFRAKQILGSKILLSDKTGIGTVDDIVFDNAGNLEYLIVANADGKLISMPWDAARWDVKSQTATLTITPEVYKTIPTFTATTYPDFWAPTYRTQVYKYYGLTPRELRRIERIVKP
jgi:hypothetical protein